MKQVQAELLNLCFADLKERYLLQLLHHGLELLSWQPPRTIQSHAAVAVFHRCRRYKFIAFFIASCYTYFPLVFTVPPHTLHVSE